MENEIELNTEAGEPWRQIEEAIEERRNAHLLWEVIR